QAGDDPRTPHSPDPGGAGGRPASALLLARVQAPRAHPHLATSASAGYRTFHPAPATSAGRSGNGARIGRDRVRYPIFVSWGLTIGGKPPERSLAPLRPLLDRERADQPQGSPAAAVGICVVGC